MISFFEELFPNMNKWHVSSLEWDDTNLKSYYSVQVNDVADWIFVKDDKN
jgi:hypothetical protein